MHSIASNEQKSETTLLATTVIEELWRPKHNKAKNGRVAPCATYEGLSAKPTITK